MTSLSFSKMMNNKSKIKRTLNGIKVCTLLFISCSLHSNTNNTNNNLVIIPATIPHERLWNIQHSWNMFDKSLDPEIPEIYNEKLLVELISQAWQWDKNAMIQYARIEWMAHDKCFIRNFYRKNAHRILDRYGFRLKRPEIFDMDYSDFILKLADMHYPLAALLVTWGHGYGADEQWGRYSPLDPETRAKTIHYKKIANNGGYHFHSALADTIIFPTGTAFYNRARSALNFFHERIPTLTQQELMESFEYYKVSALHNSQYGQIRISEFYFYGAGVEQDLERARAWALLARMNYLEFQKKYAGKFHSDKEDEGEYNDYNLDMLSKMDKYLTKAQQARGAALVAEIKSSIVTEDYYQWESEMEPIPPMP